MQSQEHDQDEFEYLDHRLLVFLQLQLFNDARKARNTRDLENFQSCEQLDSKQGPWNRSDQVNHEHSPHVAVGDALPVGDFFALNGEKGRPELHKDVDQEHEIAHVSEHLVASICIE